MTTIGYGGGSNANGKFHLKGEIAEAIIYDRALSDPEIESIESYLSKKWGLNLLTLEEIALLAIVEDIAGNTDKRPASSKQINLIIGTSIAKEETDYCIELSKGTYKDRASPTKDELINIIEKVNSAQTKNTGGGTNSPSLLLLSILLYRRFFKQHKFRESFKMQ